MKIFIKFILFIYFCTVVCWCRIHNLEIENDARRYISLSTFGFYTGGYLEVKLINFRAIPESDAAVFGFSLHRTINNYPDPSDQDRIQDHCILEDEINTYGDETLVYFKLDFEYGKLRVACTKPVHIYNNLYDVPKNTRLSAPTPCNDLSFDMESVFENRHMYYNASFVMAVESASEEGLYNLYFHNCPSYNPNTETSVDFTVEIVEQNLQPTSYLPAGDMPLPTFYWGMAILFFLSGMLWMFWVLRHSKYPSVKLHIMMTVLVFLKAITLALHGVNYYYIGRLGVHLARWAILFYVAHLLEKVLLFVVLILIGLGWTYIKPVLTSRDKKLFVAVILLQLVAIVGGFIFEESEHGFFSWKNFVLIVDVICCGCVLFPPAWSIRHFRRASQVNGQVATNRKKLQLFRHYYILLVFYIYSTRVLVYVLKITESPQNGWIHEVFRELVTYVFFVLTAYKFRPTSQNVYFALSGDGDDADEQLITKSGALEGVKKVNPRVTIVPIHKHGLMKVPEEKKDALLGNESGHE